MKKEFDVRTPYRTTPAYHAIERKRANLRRKIDRREAGPERDLLIAEYKKLTSELYKTPAKLCDDKKLKYVRYADDFLLMFQYEEEAKRVLELLRTRLAKFGLEVAEDKTRILPIGRFKGTKEDFDFLGFTFFNTKTRGGKYRLGVRTSKKKQKMKKQAAKAWLKTRLTKPVADTMRLINLSLAGHYNYYGVSGNFHAIQGFYKYVKYATYRMLNRRDQKGKFRYTKFLRVWKYYVKEPHLTTDIWNWKPTLV